MLTLASHAGGNPLVFLAIVGGIVIVGIVVSSIAQKRRREELTRFAEENDLFFSPYADDVHVKYEGFTPLDSGHSRRSTNLIHGRRDQIEWEMFDYKYTTGSGKNRSTHRRGIVVAVVPLNFRRLIIRPEGWFDKVAQLVAGADDINFESEEFSRRYHVSCDVRKFAYDVIDARMIEFLLACKPRYWQLAGNVILIHKTGSFSTLELSDTMRAIEGFLQRVPQYVRQDIGFQAR